MDIIILCGGIGSRISSISEGLPKALMPVGNGLFIDILLNRLEKFSKTIYLSLCYKPELFLAFLNNSKYKEFVKPIIEKEPLDTGGAILNVLNNSNIESSFFVVNGDSISDINLRAMKNYYLRKNWAGVIGMSKVPDTARYGSIDYKDGQVLSFIEKSGSNGSGWINNGHYIFNKDIFQKFSNRFSLEKDVLPDLVEKNILGGFVTEGDNFIDMGVPEDYRRLCLDYKNKP